MDHSHQLTAQFFLFDMDGTLVDSRDVVESVLIKFCKRHQLNAKEVIAFAHGKRSVDTVTHFLGDTELARQETERIDLEESQTMTGIKSIPGAKALLEQIGLEHWALVTSAGKDLAESRMRAAGLPLPKITVFAEEVTKGKPDPEGYKLAAKKAGVSIGECVIFEDAEAGIQAGIRSGAKKVLAVNGFTDASHYDVLEVLNLDQISITALDDCFLLSITTN